MEWHLRNDSPIYSQLVAQMELAIVSGTVRPGDRLMPVRELASEAGVNPNTMQRALQELERRGLVYSQRTAGRFVTEDAELIAQSKSSLADAQIRAFLDAMARLGFLREDILRLVEAKVKEDKSNGYI